MNHEKDNQKLAVEVKNRYIKIMREIEVIRRSVATILQMCRELVPYLAIIRDSNRSRMAWWVKTYSPSVNYAKLKVMESVGSRTGDDRSLYSWQARMLNIITPVHHSEKPVARTVGKKVKPKSWIYYVGKGHEGMIKQIEQMGGMENLTEDERNSILAQFGGLGKVLVQLGKK